MLPFIDCKNFVQAIAVREKLPFTSLPAVLHRAVIRATSPFRYDPINILGRILDIAGFAVNAVLRVDLKLTAAIALSDDLINPCGAITLRRLVIKGKVCLYRYTLVGKLQVARLIFFMISIC